MVKHLLPMLLPIISKSYLLPADTCLLMCATLLCLEGCVVLLARTWYVGVPVAVARY